MREFTEFNFDLSVWRSVKWRWRTPFGICHSRVIGVSLVSEHVRCMCMGNYEAIYGGTERGEAARPTERCAVRPLHRSAVVYSVLTPRDRVKPGQTRSDHGHTTGKQRSKNGHATVTPRLSQDRPP